MTPWSYPLASHLITISTSHLYTLYVNTIVHILLLSLPITSQIYFFFTLVLSDCTLQFLFIFNRIYSYFLPVLFISASCCPPYTHFGIDISKPPILNFIPPNLFLHTSMYGSKLLLVTYGVDLLFSVSHNPLQSQTHIFYHNIPLLRSFLYG
jgi:hypothetical protein